MITVDPRKGSADLYQYFKQPARLAHLSFADCAFEGNGPYNIPYNIGIERKNVRDLLASMQDGRLAGHQIPGLTANYNRVYLFVEGRAHYDDDGVLVEYRGKEAYPVSLGRRVFSRGEVQGFLRSLEEFALVRVVRTRDARDTVRETEQLYLWWSKDYDEHKSHKIVYCGAQNPADEDPIMALVKPSCAVRIAAQLPGVGSKLAPLVMKHFKTVKALCEAGEKEWCSLDGIGKGKAQKIVKALN